MENKTVHIIYSGLGGHFDYVFNLICERKVQMSSTVIFFGVESVPTSYIERCGAENIENYFIRKKLFSLGALIKIVRVLRQISPKLIYIHSNAAVVPTRLYRMFSKIKLVLIEHQNNSLKLTKDIKRSVFAFKHFDQVIFLTESHKESCRKLLGNRFILSKATVIRTGLPEGWFNKHNLKNEQDEIYIGMQSRLVSIKDHDTLIRAFSDVSKKWARVNLRLAGDGIERLRLEKLRDSLDLSSRVFFDGMLSKEELNIWMHGMSVYIHASYGETSSIALMEALACGVPIVASDVSGMNDFLSKDIAILVPVKNSQALAAAIESLLMNEELRQTMSSNALIFAKENCRIEDMASGFENLEKKLFGQ